MLPSIFGENLFDDFFNDDYGMMIPAWNTRTPASRQTLNSLMKTDVRELENSYEVDIDLPGFKKEDIKIDLKDGYLTIGAQQNVSNDEKDQNGKYIRQERYTGSCSRSFYVGDMKPEDISAKYADGILKISVPKQEARKLPENTSISIE